MAETNVQRLARILKLLVRIVLACNIICLLLVPLLILLTNSGGLSGVRALAAIVFETAMSPEKRQEFLMLPIAVLGAWIEVWKGAETAVWTVFFWVCGICTLVILRQAKNILDTVLVRDPFQMVNARSMKRAALSCWVISAAAVVRLVIWIWMERSYAPLFTYTCFFIPAFFMAGLLFMVMSALFQQAAELQEDQNLTI